MLFLRIYGTTMQVKKEIGIFTVCQILAYFWCFGGKFCHNLKTFSKNVTAHIILILDATFVPNFKFLAFSVLRYRLEKKRHPDGHPDIQLIS